MRFFSNYIRLRMHMIAIENHLWQVKMLHNVWKFEKINFHLKKLQKPLFVFDLAPI